MSYIASRLAELGITLPEVAKPAASYVPAVRVGNLVYTSGQLPFVSGALELTGKVGEESGLVSPEQAHQLARIAALNALAAAESIIGSLEKVSRVLRVTGYVASVPEFTGQPLVMNGASDLLVDIFGEAGRHARTAIGVPVLPLDAPVELEIILEVQD